MTMLQEIYATCSWACHDYGCTHGSGDLLEESAAEVIRHLAAGFDPFYQEIKKDLMPSEDSLTPWTWLVDETDLGILERWTERKLTYLTPPHSGETIKVAQTG